LIGNALLSYRQRAIVLGYRNEPISRVSIACRARYL
jgi:hypothetical protein